MEFIDRAFARRLEAAEGIPQVYYARLYQQLYPEVGAAAEQICGGSMVFAGVGSPIGRAVGMGLDGPVSAADLDRVEQFYSAREAPMQVDVCPLTDSSLIDMLKTRGYVMAELNNVLYRKLQKGEEFTSPAQTLSIKPGEPEQADVFADIIARSFFPEGNPPAEFHRWVAPLFQIPGARTLLASAEGEAAGCAAGLIISEHNLIALSGDATLPAFRGRGIQTALVQARLKAAVEAGCPLAVAVTQGGSTSQRNYERLGFRVAYSKATLLKACVAA